MTNRHVVWLLEVDLTNFVSCALHRAALHLSSKQVDIQIWRGLSFSSIPLMFSNLKGFTGVVLNTE